MYRYSWLITFEIFQIFLFLDTGVCGWDQLYPNFFGFLDFFYIYKVPKATLGSDIFFSFLNLESCNW